MSDSLICSVCSSPYVYEDGLLIICPECGHTQSSIDSDDSDVLVIKDAHGTPLEVGDSITLIKDLKVKGSSTVLKVGTKAKITRFLDGDHDIDCRLQGGGSMELKSQYVKKVTS
ncbi:MAG: alkylphosphonate utilization protein [Candidatus Paracaedibacteraceae bacterium]|nr:alkylphosphonate utilization protein [Candidatus Paracaedibacteraceae bacterium]